MLQGGTLFLSAVCGLLAAYFASVASKIALWMPCATAW